MKDLYREETNKDVYAEDCCMQQSSSYSDEYVHWLEAKLRQYNIVGRSEQLKCDCGETEDVKMMPICKECFNIWRIDVVF